jgi:hypothetical protein
VEDVNASRPTRDPKPPARPRSRRPQGTRLRRWCAVLSRALHRTLLSAIDHDCLNVAQSTAYSAIVALFPALIVAAAVIGLLPDTAPVRFQLAAFFFRVLPPGVSTLLDAAFEITPEHAHSVRALVSAGFVSFLGAAKGSAGHVNCRPIAGAFGNAAAARSNSSPCVWRHSQSSAFRSSSAMR